MAKYNNVCNAIVEREFSIQAGSDEKVIIIEDHFHKINSAMERLLLEPTDENVTEALKLLSYKDSNAYMFYPNWYAKKETKEIEEKIECAERFYGLTLNVK